MEGCVRFNRLIAVEFFTAAFQLLYPTTKLVLENKRSRYVETKLHQSSEPITA